MTPPNKKISYPRHTLLKKIYRWAITPLFFLLLLAVLLVGSGKAVFFFQQIYYKIQDLQTLQSAQLQDIFSLRTYLQSQCQDTNVLRSYLLLAPKNCQFPNTAEFQKEQIETPEEALYYYLTLLKENEEKEEIQQQIATFLLNWNQTHQNEVIAEQTLPSCSIESQEISTHPSLQLSFWQGEYGAGSIEFIPLTQNFIVTSPQKEQQEFTDIDTALNTLASFWKNCPTEDISSAEIVSVTSSPQESKHTSDMPEIIFPEEELDPLTPLFQNKKIHQYSNSLGFSLVLNTNDTEIPHILVEQDGKPLRKIYLDPETGKIMANTLDKNNPVYIQGLRNVIQQFEQQKAALPDLSELSQINATNTSGRENYLLLGQNGGNIDTIMLANLDHVHRHITLISIPRDIFIEEYKVNAFFARYGMQTFLEKIEFISGQKINGYVLGDFTAFTTAIDLLGGIDVTLTRDLADPTYKTVDNGQEGTLYFAKGTHHLSGVQALRIARSRATSNDFERALRQQQIVQAARSKANALSLKNINTFLQIIRTMLTHVKTDIDPLHILPQFLKVKDYEIRGGNVLSTKNVLVSEMRVLPSGTKQYILLPREEDWSLIHKFIWREILKN